MSCSSAAEIAVGPASASSAEWAACRLCSRIETGSPKYALPPLAFSSWIRCSRSDVTVRTPDAREYFERAIESVRIQVAALQVTDAVSSISIEGKGSAAVEDAGVIEEHQVARLQAVDYSSRGLVK